MSNDTRTYKEVLAEVIDQIGRDPAVSMEEIGARLGAVYADAEQRNSQDVMIMVSDAWNRIQTIYEGAQGAMTMAAAAREAAAELKHQRDQAITHHEDLLDAMWAVDTSHPMIEHVFDHAQAMFVEDIEESGGYFSTDPAYDIINHSCIPVSKDQAMLFVAMLTGAELDNISNDDVNAAMRQELAELIKRFIQKYELIIEQQWEAMRRGN